MSDESVSARLAMCRAGGLVSTFLRWGPVRLPWSDAQSFMSAGGGRVALIELARRLGVHHKQVHRWRANGLTVRAAEDVADRLRAHPSDIWGGAYWAAIADGELVAAA